MIKLIQKIKKAKEARTNLKKYKQYYKIVKAGMLFIQFIKDDIKEQKTAKMNRAQRRRFEKSLIKNGELTDEMVQTYKAKIDNVLRYIEFQLNPPKKPKIKKHKIKEGKVKKGGVDTVPTTPAPGAPKAQGAISG